jgi:CubicO group peptidase (beta-lactamase class C family)
VIRVGERGSSQWPSHLGAMLRTSLLGLPLVVSLLPAQGDWATDSGKAKATAHAEEKDVLLGQDPAQPSRELAEVFAAYAAKVAASAIFVSGRSLDSVLAEELAPTRPLEALVRPLLRFDVDRDAGTVTCRIGAATAVAVRTRNLGCTLVRADAPLAMLQQRGAPGLADLRPDPATLPWPLGDRATSGPPDGVDTAAMQRAVDAAFVEANPAKKVHTRAVVVVHRDRIVGERYAPGYDAAMPLPGWSMAKTLTHALLGARVQQGALDPRAPLDVPEWRDDERRTIGLGDLLAMSGGLAWNEDYDDPASDALRMLFGSGDHAAVYAARPRDRAPGTSFVYASGATNLLCRLLRRTFADDRDYHAFPHAALFAELGMRSAVLETDPSGTFVGSSYAFASARDWARFGWLYANDGVVGSRRILPPGWVAAATAPQPASGGRYGHQVWLNADPDGAGPRERAWPELPANLFYCNGHEGQYVVLLPDEQLVVVRLGCTKNGGFDLHGLLRGVLAAVRP